MKGICKHYGEEFDCCKLLSDFSNPMPDLRPCTKDEHECEYYKPHTNFDRITENEEALAKFVYKVRFNCALSDYGCDYCILKDLGDCNEKNIKEWLQKGCEE